MNTQVQARTAQVGKIALWVSEDKGYLYSGFVTFTDEEPYNVCLFQDATDVVKLTGKLNYKEEELWWCGGYITLTRVTNHRVIVARGTVKLVSNSDTEYDIILFANTKTKESQPDFTGIIKEQEEFDEKSNTAFDVPEKVRGAKIPEEQQKKEPESLEEAVLEISPKTQRTRKPKAANKVEVTNDPDNLWF